MSRHQGLILEARGFKPSVPESCFVAPQSSIIGDVTLGEKCSVWFQAVLRGDVMPIKVGDETNIQDGTVIHGTYNKAAATLGRRVTVGHNVTLHGCTIEDKCLIGMGSTLMDGSIIKEKSIVGAGSLVTEDQSFESGMLILGRPAKAIRPLNEKELAFLDQSADNYLHYMTWY